MGGKVFNDTMSMDRTMVLASIIDIQSKIFLPLKLDWAEVGSNGKRGKTGDIDIAVSGKSIDELIDFFAATYPNLQYKVLSNNILSIKGDVFDNIGIPCGACQIDLIVTDDIQFTEWMYYSPSKEESAFSGKYRNIMLSTICEFSRSDNDDSTYERFLLNYSTGLYLATYTDYGKTGKYLTVPKVLNRQFITKDPDEIVSYIFGREFSHRDVMTLDDIWKILNNVKCKWYGRSAQIIEAFALNSIVGYGSRKMFTSIDRMVTEQSL